MEYDVDDFEVVLDRYVEETSFFETASELQDINNQKKEAEFTALTKQLMRAEANLHLAKGVGCALWYIEALRDHVDLLTLELLDFDNED
jgi:hypothetical protein